MSKVTEWYPASVKPVREGWYQVKYAGAHVFDVRRRFWNGTHWKFNDKNSFTTFGWRGDKWRGLAEKPA